MMRSTASRKHCLLTHGELLRAAMSAASLHTLAMSAPENPGVCRASVSTSTVSSIFMGRRCTLNIAFRSLRSGRSTCICRSKRPARSSALSSMSARLVAARIMIPLLVPNPSISVSSWLSVFSRSSLPPVFTRLARARPMASISSMKMMHGDFSLACWKRSRTRLAPTPTNISTKSLPDIEKNGTSASPATAFASRVLPVPGGPTSRAPFGILPPSSVYLAGFFRKSTISCTSRLASVCPATSLNVMRSLVESCSKSLAFDFPKLNMPPAIPPPPMRFMMKNQKKTSITIGAACSSMFHNMLSSCSYVSLPLNLPASLAASTCCSLPSTEPNSTCGTRRCDGSVATSPYMYRSPVALTANFSVRLSLFTSISFT